MLEVKDLSVRFGGLTAVDQLSFTVEAGTVFTMMGPNGAGKTTAFNAIGGFTAPSQGTVRFDGIDLAGRPAEAIAALGVRRTATGAALPYYNSGYLKSSEFWRNGTIYGIVFLVALLLIGLPLL